MKILIATESHFPGYGGPYTAISQNAKYLYKNDINFKLIYKQTDLFKYNLNLKEIISNFDIIHVYGIWTPFSIRVCNQAFKLNKKVIISTLGALEPWSLNQKKWKKKIAWNLYQRKILNNATAIHATSVDEKKHLLELGIKSKIEVLLHGIEIQDLEDKKINKSKNKKLLYFSRIHEKKGILELINSWKIINNDEWTLDIYGPVTDQKYLSLIKQNIEKLSLSNKVKIFDPIFEKALKKKIYTSSDCFILPSKSENFGISIGEALSFGLPVITTTSTPWKEITDYNAGFLFDFSQENLTKYLKKLIGLSNEQLKKMGQNAVKLISDNYDFNKIIVDYIKFYKSL